MDLDLTIKVIAGIVPLWAIAQWLLERSKLARKDDFDTYHRLVKELVEGGDAGTFEDRQAAIVFELRRFTRYFPVTTRVLKHFREKTIAGYPMLDREIQLTLAYIESHRPVMQDE